MKVEAADPKVSGELLFPPPYGIIGIVIRCKSSLRSFDVLTPTGEQTGKGGVKEKRNRGETKGKDIGAEGLSGEKGNESRAVNIEIGNNPCFGQSTFDPYIYIYIYIYTFFSYSVG